ncbi:MAG: hypothetical protein HQK54_14925, partial [Oligoflexales bacterium]|nr:hypothetical protein [Oligoflexales bacterium]
METIESPKSLLNETIVICDNNTWIWNFITKSLSSISEPHVRFPSSISIKQSFVRFQNARRIILLWENTLRSTGGIIEEILEIAPGFDISEKLIVVTMEPTKEDIIYLNELSICRIVKIVRSPHFLSDSAKKLILHMSGSEKSSIPNILWSKIFRILKNLSAGDSAKPMEKMTEIVEKAKSVEVGGTSAAYYDAKACISAAGGDGNKALGLWKQAIEKNPTYYRSFNNLIDFYEVSGNYPAAL